MKKSRIIIESCILILLLVLTLSILLRNQDMSEILEIIRDCNPIYIIMAFLAMAFYVFAGGYEVKIFLRERGYKMSVFKCFKYGFTEIFFSSITPSSTGGQPMMAMSMRNDQYPLTVTTPALMAITGLYKSGLLLLGIICCVLYSGRIFFGAGNWIWLLFIIGFFINIIVVLCVGLFLFSNRCIWYLFKIVLFIGCKLRVIKNRDKTEAYFKNKKSEYMNCAGYMKESPLVVFKVFILCILQRLAITSVSALVYKAMSIGGSDISFIYIMAIQIIVALTVEILPLPGAVGISETAFLALFLPIYGTPELLNAGMLLTRGINFYLLFAVSAVFVNVCYISSIVKGFIKRGVNK